MNPFSIHLSIGILHEQNCKASLFLPAYEVLQDGTVLHKVSYLHFLLMHKGSPLYEMIFQIQVLPLIYNQNDAFKYL